MRNRPRAQLPLFDRSATGRVSLPGLVMADFIDSEAKQDGKAGGRTSMDETSQSDSSSVIVSQSTPGFAPNATNAENGHVLSLTTIAPMKSAVGAVRGRNRQRGKVAE